MDLYRYFHPHHNPRLRRVPIRLQELAELEQAAEELKRALSRARIRVSTSPVLPIEADHFQDILTAMSFVVDSLHTLHEAHPGDDWKTMTQLLEERKATPGWENWSRLLLERLHLMINEPSNRNPTPFTETDHLAATGISSTEVDPDEGPETFGASPLLGCPPIRTTGVDTDATRFVELDERLPSRSSYSK